MLDYDIIGDNGSWMMSCVNDKQSVDVVYEKSAHSITYTVSFGACHRLFRFLKVLDYSHFG